MVFKLGLPDISEADINAVTEEDLAGLRRALKKLHHPEEIAAERAEKRRRFARAVEDWFESKFSKFFRESGLSFEIAKRRLEDL